MVTTCYISFPVHHKLYHFYDQIIQDTILDNEVLDVLISRCILRKEDRAEIENHPRQSDRNKCILELLIERPQDSYNVLLEVLKESLTCSKDLIEVLEGQLYSHHKIVSQSTVKSCITGVHSVRLQKNYHNLTQNLSNTECIIDLLISKGVLDPDDRSEIVSSGVQAKINRKLIDQIRSEQDYQFFLEALKEDPTNTKLASELESIDVKPDELKLLQTGIIIPSLTNKPGFKTMVTLVSMVKAVQISNREPKSHDTGLSADLYRLQFWYKQILKMKEMDSHQYQHFFQTVKEILVRLGEDDDPVDISWNVGMQKEVKKLLCGLKEKAEHSDLKEKIKKMETEQNEVILKNVRDQIEKEINEWEIKDKMFLTTRASEYVIGCLHDNSCLTLTAPSGVGKSCIARHTALVLQKEGYTIIPVRKPDNISDYYQPGKQTVFIVDDICGNFTANQQQIENWQQLLPVINTIIADKGCKIIVSCRLQVYNDDRFKILQPFKSCVCNLMSDELSLTSVEKNLMAKNYIGSSLDDLDSLQTTDFFPLLCSLYDRKKHGSIVEFFKNPFFVYQNELQSLRRNGDEGNYKLCSLALLVLFNNQLKEKWFQDKLTPEQRRLIEDTCEACGLNRGTSKAKLKEALDTLEGTFVYKQNLIYRALHDKLFDFLAHHFAQKMIECLIEHGESDLVHERFILRQSPGEKNNTIEFIIEIPEDNLEAYLKRCIKDWSEGKVRVTLCNNNMEVPLFRQQLLQHLRQLEKSQQVLLTNMKDTVLHKEHHGSGTTSLIIPCHDGYADMVQWILHNDVDVDQRRDDGSTGLIFACQNGHTEIVKLLLDRNPNINLCAKNGCSPLFMASQEGHTDVVKLLLEKNSTVDLCNNDGCSPLYMASQEGYTEIVKLLLERNPDIDLCNKEGCSPLHIASRKGQTEIVKLLLEKNPDIDLCKTNGGSSLCIASLEGYTGIVKLLLEKNSNVDQCDNKGCSPLFMASQKGYTEIVKLLLERNPDIDLCNKSGCSPLYMASHKGQTEIVKLLLEKNPDVNLCANNGACPLRQASQNGYTDIVKLLLKENAKVDICANNGSSPLVIASEKGHTQIVKLLLEMKANVNLRNNNRCSPLYMASQEGHTDIVKSLLEWNPDVNLCNNDGFSPLYIASLQGLTDIVRLILHRNPDVDICDNNGRSALNIARENGHTEIVRILSETALMQTIKPMNYYSH